MYVLHLLYPSGAAETRIFPSAFARALWMIALASHPVVVRIGEAS